MEEVSDLNNLSGKDYSMNTYTYNYLNQCVSATDAMGQTQTYEYDPFGNVLQSVDRNGDTTLYTYTPLGHLSYVCSTKDNTSVSYTYDKLGNRTSMTDATGTTDYIYNIYNQLVREEKGNTVKEYTYDLNGNLKETIEKNGGDVYYTYSIFGVTQVIGADGISGSAINETVYNGLGQVIKTKGRNQNGETAEESYTYDLLGRVSSKTSPDGTVQNYTYDNNSNILSYDMVKGNETKNSITYEYNALNRLTKLTNDDTIFIYQYDKNGNLTLIANQNTANFDLRMSYNSANLPITKYSNYGGKKYDYSMGYHLNGQKYIEEEATDKISTVYFYNSLGQLEMEERTQNDLAVSFDYSYDTRGNRTKMNEYVQATGAHNITDYSYDANNRMTEVTHTVSGNIADTTRYYYDANGNTISEQKKTYTTGKESSNMAISGRIGSSSIKLYQYDAFNRLIQYNDSASEATYTYGADNLRASKTVNGVKTDFVWNGQNLTGETKNSITTAYTYDPTGIALYRTNGETTRYIKDAHGNVVATTRNNSIAGEYDYTAFGVQQNSTDTSNPFRYCGEYYDNESGLVYLRNRYYQAETGRFITEDPVKDGLNWYSYCAGEPVMSFDPLGLYEAGNTVWGITKIISNIEEMETGYYGSLRDISEYASKPYELKWEEVGGGAKVTYTFDTRYTMEITFNSRSEGTYASNIRYLYTNGGKTLDITKDSTNSKKNMIEQQSAQFYLKKDENSDNIVVMSKISTTLYINKAGPKEKYLFAVISLAKQDTENGTDSFQDNLDKWTNTDLIYMDSSQIGAAYEAMHNNWSSPADFADWLKYVID